MSFQEVQIIVFFLNFIVPISYIHLLLPELEIEIRNRGAIFTYKGGEEGVMSCISVLNCSTKDQEYFLL